MKDALARLHFVDKCLLLFMGILLSQSAYSLFLPGAANQVSENIDVVARTASASIFGYFISANFASCAPSGGQTPAGGRRHIVGTADAASPDPHGVTSRIGFTCGPAEEASGDASIREGESTPPAAQVCRLQMGVAAGIGLFCLIMLILLRNAACWNPELAQNHAASATVVQFRDFVSGCVGFLIGCPTHGNSQVSSL